MCQTVIQFSTPQQIVSAQAFPHRKHRRVLRRPKFGWHEKFSYKQILIYVTGHGKTRSQHHR